MKRYNTDLNGTNADNQFEETIIVSESHPTQIYILDNIPFFEDLKVTVKGSTTPMVRGTDYELAHRIEELKGAARSDVYNGITILKPFHGILVCVGQTVGWGKHKPIIDAVGSLLRYINEPLVTDYVNVDERPALFPPKPTYRPWFNITNKQYLASAIEDTADNTVEAATNAESAIVALIERTQQLRQTMIALNVPGHIAANNPHNVTVEQLNAHPANLPAADTALAYGHDVLELVNIIRSQGLTKADLDKYIHRYGSSDVSGAFDFAEGKAKIYSEDGLTSIQLDNGTLQLNTNGVATIRAGHTKTAGRFLEIVTGDNTLRIESSGNALDDSKVTLNGKAFITTDNIFNYNPDDVESQDETVNIKHQGVHLTPSGFGSPSNPLKVDFTPPKATATTIGSVTVGESTPTPADNHAVASSTALKPIGQLIPNTWKVDGQPLSGNITITKASVGLDKVDNTMDMNKPISDPLKVALDNLAAKTHKHTLDGLEIPAATTNTEGGARIANNIAQFNALLQEIENSYPATEDEDFDYDGDMPSRMFGVSHSFYLELRAAFYASLPNVEDVLDTRELEVAATSGAAFSVNGSILTVVGDNKYLAPKSEGGMGAVVGIIKGGVNLNNVSTEQWVSDSCGLDFDFPYGIADGMTFQGLGDAIRINDSNKQNKAGIKYRLNHDDGILSINWGKNVPMVVYINGERITTSTTAGTLQREVPRGVSIVAFEYDTSSATVPTVAIAIDLIELDGKTTRLASTKDQTRFGYIAPTAPFDNNRFYLYVNASTGNVFATIGTYDYNTISKQFVYIGYVDTSDGQVMGGNQIVFRGVIDYGMFAELEVHRADNDAHASTTSVPRGLEAIQPHGLMSGTGVRSAPIYAVIHNSTSELLEVSARDTAVSTVVKQTNSEEPHPVEILSRVVDKTPLQFRSFNNALNPTNRPVYEGCIQYYSNDVVRPDDADFRASERIALVFTRPIGEDKTRRLRIWLKNPQMQAADYDNLDSNHAGTLSSGVSNLYDTTITRETVNFHGDLSGYIQTRQNLENGIRVASVDYTGQIAYRYNPENNTLKVYHRKQAYRATTFSAGSVISPTVFGVTYDIEILTITPSVDISPYFPSKDVGLYVTANGSSALHWRLVEFGIAATPFPIPNSVGDYRNFIDYDELFKTFLAADVVSEYSALNNGMRYGRFNANVNEVNVKFPGGTGYYGETALGVAVTSAETTFPICMLPTRSNRYDQIVKYPLGLSLRNWTEVQRIRDLDFHRVGMSVIGTGGQVTKGASLEIPNKLTLYYDIDTLMLGQPNAIEASEVRLVFRGNSGIEVYAEVSYCGRGSIIPQAKVLSGYSDSYQVTLSNFRLDTIPQIRRVAKFTLTMHDGVELQYGMWLSWTMPDGTVHNHPQAPVVAETLELKPQTRGVVYYTPWHITSRTWEWYCSEGKNKS